MTVPFRILFSLLLSLSLIGCMLHTSGLAPDLATPTDPGFHGCFERTDHPSGRINICQGSGDQLSGTGSGLFDDSNFNDRDTVLLIQGNTAITDVATGSTPPKMITPNDNARVQNAFSRFGGGAISFDGSGDYLSIPDHADFNFSDGTWTVDFWVRVNALGGEYMMYYQQMDASNYMYIKIQADNTVRFGVMSGGAHIVILTTPAVISSTGRFYHIEVAENGNNYYIFIDGVQQASTSDTSRPANYTGPVYIGADSGGGQSLNGYLDEIRVSRIARHIANFTPPTEEWRELGWSFTGEVTARGMSTLHITTERAPEMMFDIEAWNPLVGGTPDRTRLMIRRDGTTYELPTACPPTACP